MRFHAVTLYFDVKKIIQDKSIDDKDHKVQMCIIQIKLEDYELTPQQLLFCIKVVNGYLKVCGKQNDSSLKQFLLKPIADGAIYEVADFLDFQNVQIELNMLKQYPPFTFFRVNITEDVPQLMDILLSISNNDIQKALKRKRFWQGLICWYVIGLLNCQPRKTGLILQIPVQLIRDYGQYLQQKIFLYLSHIFFEYEPGHINCDEFKIKDCSMEKIEGLNGELNLIFKLSDDFLKKKVLPKFCCYLDQTGSLVQFKLFDIKKPKTVIRGRQIFRNIPG